MDLIDCYFLNKMMLFFQRKVEARPLFPEEPIEEFMIYIFVHIIHIIIYLFSNVCIKCALRKNI